MIPIERKIPIGRMIPVESVNVGILKIPIKSNDWYVLKFKLQNTSALMYKCTNHALHMSWSICIEIKQQKDNGQVIYKD